MSRFKSSCRSFPLLILWVTASIIIRKGCTQLVNEVTMEMFTVLQAEVDDLYTTLGTLQDDMQKLSAKVDNLDKDTNTIGDIELAEIRALVEVSNKQEEDITKLYSTNGLWQKNFRVINSTFARLKNVVVFPMPSLNTPMLVASTQRILPMVSTRNVSMVRLRMKNKVRSRPMNGLTWTTPKIPYSRKISQDRKNDPRKPRLQDRILQRQST